MPAWPREFDAERSGFGPEVDELLAVHSTPMYVPTAGGIEIDGVPLSGLDIPARHARTTAAFQDFHRYQVKLRHAVGFGDIAAAEEDDRLLAAISEADGKTLYRT